MLGRITALFTKHQNNEAFFGIVSRHHPKGSSEYLMIQKAYQVAKDAFRHEERDDGERYFEHLRCVALILMEHMRIYDAEMIAAALLHDIIEDIKDWTQERVALEFSQRVSEIVWWVTKPPIDAFGGDTEARNRAYHTNLGRAPRDAIKVKLADRMHNLLTLWKTTKEKRLRKIRETQDYYLPLAEKETLLIHEFEVVLKQLLK
jgi:GTP pyrophosphokinase